MLRNKNLFNLILITTLSIMFSGCGKNDGQNNVDKILNKQQSSKSIKTEASIAKVINKIMTSAPTESINKILASQPIANTKVIESVAVIAPNKINVSLIPTDFAFTFNPSAKHKITVIGNLENNFIQRFVNNDIEQLKDTTVYLLIVSSNQDEVEKLSQIYCSPNKLAAINTFYSSNQIENQNKNCNKDGLNYTQSYVENNLSKYQLPVIIFEDGNIVNNSMNANAALINQYLSN